MDNRGGASPMRLGFATRWRRLSDKWYLPIWSGEYVLSAAALTGAG